VSSTGPVCAAFRRMAGQSLVEYLVALALLTAVVAIPIGGHESLVALVLDAVRIAFNRFTAALSLAW